MILSEQLIDVVALLDGSEGLLVHPCLLLASSYTAHLHMLARFSSWNRQWLAVVSDRCISTSLVWAHLSHQVTETYGLLRTSPAFADVENEAFSLHSS